MHFGAPNPQLSLAREKHLVSFLEKITPEVEELYLLGDLFDFWFEYRQVVPRGYVRFMGQLAKMRDLGIPIHVFQGNHDLWHQTYLVEQLGVELHRDHLIKEFFGSTYFLAHGDGLGPGDHGYKLMKKIVTHPLSKWLFSRLHPNFGIGLALWVSQHGGEHDYRENKHQERKFDLDKDPLWIFAKNQLAEGLPVDHFVFGHRHQLEDEELQAGKRLFILGDWIHFFSYLKIDAEGPHLHTFPLNPEDQTVSV